MSEPLEERGEFDKLADDFDALTKFMAAAAKNAADSQNLTEYVRYSTQASTFWTLSKICRKLSSYDLNSRREETTLQRGLRISDNRKLGEPLHPTVQDPSLGSPEVLRRDQPRHDQGISTRRASNHSRVIEAPPLFSKSIKCPHCDERLPITSTPKTNIGLLAAHLLISHPEMPYGWELLS